MWVFTTKGFYSAVCVGDYGASNPDIAVRSRVREDLVRFLDKVEEGEEMFPILELPGRDYPYRVIVPRNVWVQFMTATASEVDYPNFKDAVKGVLGYGRASLYTKVWSVMYGAEKTLEALTKPVDWGKRLKTTEAKPAKSDKGGKRQYKSPRD